MLEETRQQQNYTEVLTFKAAKILNVGPLGYDTTVWPPLASMVPDPRPKKFTATEDCVQPDRPAKSITPPLPRPPNRSTPPSPQCYHRTCLKKSTSPPPDKKSYLQKYHHYLSILTVLPPSLIL